MPRLEPGRPQTCPAALRVGKAYFSRAIRALLRAWGVTAVIPEPADQIRHGKNRGANGGRPPKLDKQSYKGLNVVERACNELKQWRGLAARYDKHALIFRGGVVLASIMLWLKHMGDTP